MAETRNSLDRLRYALDTPQTEALPTFFRVSGWWISKSNEPAAKVVINVNGQPVAQAVRSIRKDVGDCFPDIAKASLSGFLGDAFIPDDLRDRKITISCSFIEKDGNIETVYWDKEFRLSSDETAPYGRVKSFDFEDLWLTSSRHVACDEDQIA